MAHRKTILIAGPTASGKSGLATALAARIGGAVINADSMQVYRELSILSARPSADDLARAPHHLYGHVGAHEGYSAGRFATDVATTLQAVRAAGQTPIIVGGTGLYFKVLLVGLSPIPPIPDDVRNRWRAFAAEHGAARLHAELARRDATMAARLAPGDTQRLTRALEVLDATGQSLADWQRVPGRPIVPEAETLRFVFAPPRDDLFARCDARFDAMMAAGALDEVAALRELDLAPGLPALGALGVEPLLAHLAGDVPLEAAIATAKTATRHYAKRQITWVRRHMMSWNLIYPQQTGCSIADKIALAAQSDVDPLEPVV